VRVGDGADRLAHAGLVGQLVDAFLPDHGAVHVGQQHLLFPPFAGLGDHVHAFGLQAVPDRGEVLRQFRHLELRRVVGVEPDGIAPPIALRRLVTSAGSRYIAGFVISVTVNIGSPAW
jgi:hypothetical protein